ncbi:MAG TPA: 50S ribosomal protein L22 [Bacteroidota bacterium]|nr:50S ribosomal protein L22 [Bacteroidota bacterium]
MEARAINRYVGTSPRKMRLVIDLIRGKGVDEALNILHFVPKHAAKTAEKVLRSAISNFQNKEESGRVDTATLYVKEAFVDGGPMLKRISPAPMGRAYRIRKRSNHITIVIAQREQSVKPSVARRAKATQPEPKAAVKPSEQKEAKAKKTPAATAKKKTKAETPQS